MPFKTVPAAVFKNRFKSEFATYTPESAKGREKPPDAPEKPVSETAFEIRPCNDWQKLNKLEKQWFSEINAGEYDWVGIQNMTLKLGDDCRYTPDFMALDGGKLVAFECKGHMRDDALVKLKTAARNFSWIRFIIVRWDKEKRDWDLEEVRP